MWGPEPVITRRCWRGLRARRGRLWRMRSSMTWGKTLSETSAISQMSPCRYALVQKRRCQLAMRFYVNAGATAPLDVWLDALQLNGRLLFPLTPADGPGGMPGAGGMILVTRTGTDHFDARFVCAAMFVSCFGARDEETAQKLSAAFKRGDSNHVRTLRRNSKPDDSCWCAGNGWWLSTV